MRADFNSFAIGPLEPRRFDVSVNRIQKGYEVRFRSLLKRLGARRMDEALLRLLRQSETCSAREGISQARALARVERRLQQNTARF